LGRGLAALAAVAIVLSGHAQQAPPSWSTYGNRPERHNFASTGPAPPLARWRVHLDGGILTQPLVVRDGGTTFVYVGTTRGSVYALDETGRIRWRVELESIDHDCPQLPRYGVTGTPVVDPQTHALYAADAVGRLHALDLATGAERPGWPVTLYDDFRSELVWGALLRVGGAVYIPTASYCDIPPMQGKLIRVSLAGRAVQAWTVVPARLGGGGGIWAWGGVSYSTKRGSIYAATGNAFARNEAAGYGEHLVELTPALRVRSANHPPSVAPQGDIDFGGAPMLVSARGCGELVVAPSKNGRLYAWRSAALRRGTAWTFDLRRLKPTYALVTELAYAPPLRSIFVATGTRLVRLSLTRNCKPRLQWTVRIPRWAYNGSPTVAGGLVWFGLTKTKRLLAVDARTGRVRATVALNGAALAAPAAASGRLYVGTMTGWLYGFSRR